MCITLHFLHALRIMFFLTLDILISESALREEVVRNYKAFMHATEEIRTMEADIQTLKDLLGSTAVTLQVQLTLFTTSTFLLVF